MGLCSIFPYVFQIYSFANVYKHSISQILLMYSMLLNGIHVHCTAYSYRLKVWKPEVFEHGIHGGIDKWSTHAIYFTVFVVQV